MALLFPVGRMVQGSMSEPQTKDKSGNPLTVKKPGPEFGKPTVKFFFSVAIPKSPPGSAGVDPSTGAPVAQSPHNHWACTTWGQKIWAAGFAAWPSGQAQLPKFAWKIKDGDSNEPNEAGRIPSKSEGFPGHWIVAFSSNYAVKTFDARGQQAVDPKSIKRGHYVEVYGTIVSNEDNGKPGMYINHSHVAHAGFGPEITSGPDPSSLGFGQGQLPAGATTVPQSSMQPPTGSAVAPPSTAPAAVAPPVNAAAPAPAVAAPTAVTPHAGYMNPNVVTVAAPPVAAPAVAAPPVGPVWKPGAPAGGYAAHKAAGWTDDQMRAAGYI